MTLGVLGDLAVGTGFQRSPLPENQNAYSSARRSQKRIRTVQPLNSDTPALFLHLNEASVLFSTADRHSSLE